MLPGLLFRRRPLSGGSRPSRAGRNRRYGIQISFKWKSEELEDCGKMPLSTIATKKTEQSFCTSFTLKTWGSREMCFACLKSVGLSSVTLLTESFVWQLGCRVEHADPIWGSEPLVWVRKTAPGQRAHFKKVGKCRTDLYIFNFCSFLSLSFKYCRTEIISQISMF